MVNTKYHLRIFYNKDGIPLRAEYVKNANIEIVVRTFEEIGCIRGDEEYYCEYDNLGVFIYTKNGKIIKSRTWVQDYKIPNFTTDYKPKKTITYTEV